MKHTLVMAVSMFTLLSWSAVGALNPHIREIDLDIEGVDDGLEFGTATEPGGPGGFVESNGWKKITLSYTAENPPTKIRLNWNSDKIKVFTATNNGTEIANGTIWEPASDMPSTLYVKGVAVSASGPTATTCGPEHMCLEAINNGSPYLYDRIGFTVFDLNIRTKKKDASDWDSDSAITEIAAGGLTTAVHYADVEIEMTPTNSVSSSFPLTICLTTNSGGGYLPTTEQQWWWPAEVHKRALLTLGSATYECGASSSPITLTSFAGSIAGTLRSSNKVEPSTIRAEFAGFSLEKAVNFGRGEFQVNLPSTVEPYQWISMTCTRLFIGIPLEGHRMKIFCQRVEQPGGTVVDAELGSSQSTSYALESFVWIGEHPSESYYTGEGWFDEVSSDSSGCASSQFNVRGFQKRVVLAVVDLTTTEYYTVAPSLP